MLIPSINLIDLYLSFTYILVFILFSFFIKKKIQKQTKAYFLPFVIYKIITAIAFALLHVYYYKGGDTFVYFQSGNFFAEQILANPKNIFHILSLSHEEINNLLATKSYNTINLLNARDSLFMAKITSFFCILGFKQFMTTSIIFTLISCIGVWKLFTTLSNLYPSIIKYFAYGTLFFPTVAIWSSGILKDPITLCAIGLIFYSTYLILNKKKLLFSILSILFSIYICLALKPYVLYLFIPALLFWSQSKLQSYLRGKIIKSIVTPVILALMILGGFFLLNEISEGAGKYSLENIENVARGFHSWHNHLAETRDQSGYTLGKIEYSLEGIIKKIPQSIFVTFFRPFPIIDTRNIATLFEGIQSFTLLIITLYCIQKVNFLTFFRIIITNRTVFSFLFFALAFGFAVGFTSYNFGALSRYKIPALPFYTASLAIIVYEAKIIKRKSVYKL